MTEILHGDCLTELRKLAPDSIDALATDPPAGISFMGKDWDGDKGGRDQWIAWMREVMSECLRVLKPGAHGLVWALPRTSHWTATALEDAGFEVRDIVTHLFGSGFPKSSALNRAKSGEFCQCGASTHSIDHNSHELLPHGRIDTDPVSFDGALLLEDALHSKHGVLGSRDDCLPSGDSYGEPLRPDSVCAQGPSPSPQCAQERSHFVERGGALDCESERIPSRAQDIGRPSNLDCSPPDCVSPSKQNDKELSRRQTRTTRSDSDKRASRNDHTDAFLSASEGSSQFLRACQVCGKPQANGWYNGGLKPASEHWILVRKPCSEKTVAANVQRWGTGAINVDGCRVGTSKEGDPNRFIGSSKSRSTYAQDKWTKEHYKGLPINPNQGRFPANLVLSHTPYCTDGQCDIECAIAEMDRQSGLSHARGGNPKQKSTKTTNVALAPGGGPQVVRNDFGGASRFFYCAKPSKRERNAGCEGLDGTEAIQVSLGPWESADLKAQLLVDTASSPPRVIGVSGTMSSSVTEWNMTLFGSDTSAQSHRSTRSTTKTKLSSTIRSKTLSWLARLNTSASIQDANLLTVSGGSLAELARCSDTFANTTNVQTDYVSNANHALLAGQFEIRSVGASPSSNTHPTIKPIKLMRYLIRMITPPGGQVLDPFTGSGTTGVAALEEGMRFVGIEREAEYVQIAEKRIYHAIPKMKKQVHGSD